MVLTYQHRINQLVFGRNVWNPFSYAALYVRQSLIPHGFLHRIAIYWQNALYTNKDL